MGALVAMIVFGLGIVVLAVVADIGAFWVGLFVVLWVLVFVPLWTGMRRGRTKW
jgi:hypothetical protein